MRRTAIAAVAAVLCVGPPLTAVAQPANPTAIESQALAPMPLPLVPPETALVGAALVAALKKGGLVLYMRHALQFPPTDEDCTKPALKPEGIEQTVRVAGALRALGVPIGRVLTSTPCRNQETARRLALGPVEVTTDLNAESSDGADRAATRRKRLEEPPRPATNTLLVGHVHGGKDKADWLHLELAEIIVFRPGQRAPLARIRVGDWDRLVKG